MASCFDAFSRLHWRVAWEDFKPAASTIPKAGLSCGSSPIHSVLIAAGNLHSRATMKWSNRLIAVAVSWLVFALMLLAWLFPPWIEEVARDREVYSDWRWVGRSYQDQRINFGLLAFEWGAILAFGGVLYLTLSHTMHSSSSAAATPPTLITDEPQVLSETRKERWARFERQVRKILLWPGW